jgi:polysaccharide export outer membrane protein
MKTRAILTAYAGVAIMFALSGVEAGAQVTPVPPTSPPQPPAAGAPAAPGATPDAVDPMTLWTGGRYRITPSDVLELHFPFVPEFNQTVTVQPDGYISLSGVGDIRVQGRTVPEAKALLIEAYQGILRDPAVNIVLKEFEKPYFIVSGEVGKPGKYELRGATTLTQGMALAGGYTEAAKHSNVLLFRRFGATDWLEVKQIDVKKMFASRDLSEDPILRPGDTVFVPKSTFSKVAPFIPKFGWGLYFNPF